MTIDIKAIISAVDQTGPAFKSAQRGINEFASSSRRAAGLLAGIFGALSVGGIVAGLKGVTDEMDRVSKSAQKIGTTVEALSALEYAASLSDISVEQLQLSLAKLARNLDDAKTGSGQAADAFARLKIDPSQFTDPSDALKAIAARFAAMPDGVTKTALAMKLFGKTGADLIPLLNSGADGIAQMEAEARRLGITFDLKTALAAEAFNDNITRLSAGMRGFMIDVLSPVIPLLAELSSMMTDSGDAASGAEKNISGFGLAIKTVVETIAILGVNVKYVFESIGVEISFRAAQAAALAHGNLAEAKRLGNQLETESKKARAELDAAEQRILNPKKIAPATPRKPFDAEAAAAAAAAAAARKSAADAAARAAAAAARQEAVALVKAQEALEKARIDAVAQGLEDSLATRREKLDQARKQELIDDAGFIAAKAALDEEGLRNELAALQDQQTKLRQASVAPGAKGSERTQALADLALVGARIESASQKILNLNQAATADLSTLALAKLKSQADYIDGLQQEAFLSGLSNDEREKALLLLEAEKLGITDVNRLLELQDEIQANANAKKAADETKRQQDDLYKSVQEGVQRAFADGLNAIATGEGGFRGALKNLADTIRKAMSNALAGSLTESFLGMLGGKEGVLNIAGSLGLGSKRGETPLTPMFVQDISTASSVTGLLKTGDAKGPSSSVFDAIGTKVGGIFDEFKTSTGSFFSEFFSSMKGGFGDLFNGIGSLFSGIFSGGSGGGSSGGNISGWVSAIAKLFGYADGGYTGDGGKYQPAGVVHAGEYVFNADSVRRLGLGALDNLHRIASGGFAPRAPRWGYADGGLVNLPSAAAPTVNANTKIVNVIDPSLVSGFLATSAGERAILNIIERNPGSIKQVLS